MAGEIQVIAEVSIKKGSLDWRSPGSNSRQSLTLTGTGVGTGGRASIPTTAGGTALATTGITTPGIAYFRNLDTTNYIELGRQVGGTFYPFVKLKAGEFYIFRLGTTAPYAMANSGAVVLEYQMFED